MKLKVNNLKKFKSLVSLMDTSSNKTGTSQDEKCIYISAKKPFTVLLATLSSSKYKLIRHYVDAEVEEEGSVYINSTDFNKMLKAMPASCDSISIEFDSGELICTANMYGGVKEPVHFNQSAFNGLWINKLKDFSTLLDNSNEVVASLSSISKASSTGDVYFKCDEEGTSLYAEIFSSTYLRIDNAAVGADFSCFLPSNVLRYCALGSDIKLEVSINPKALKFSSTEGSFTFVSIARSSTYYDDVDWALEVDSQGTLIVDLTELIKIIDLQSYSNKTGGLRLSSDEENLKLCSDTGKSTTSSIPFMDRLGFEDDVFVSVEALTKACTTLKSLGNTEVRLDLRVHALDENESVKILTLRGNVGEIVLYEMVVLEK